MFEAKALSKIIRDKKKRTSFRPDLDDAAQYSVDPNEAWDAKQDAEVNTILDDPDHEPATEAEMGEHDNSQDTMDLKRAMQIVMNWFSKMKIEE